MMNTKQLPAIVMLLAGLITCVIAIVTKMETVLTLKILLAVLIGFYVLGLIVKMIFDKIIRFDENTENVDENSIPDIETENEKENQ